MDTTKLFGILFLHYHTRTYNQCKMSQTYHSGPHQIQLGLNLLKIYEFTPCAQMGLDKLFWSSSKLAGTEPSKNIYKFTENFAK